MRGVLIAFAVLVALGMIGAGVYLGVERSRQQGDSTASTSTTPTAPAYVATVDVTAVDLEASYRANEVRADDQFKGKVVRVTGVVDRIAKDVLDHPVVVLATSEAFGGVTCAFAGPDNNLLGLDRGMRVTLRGRCDGYALGGVGLGDCSVDEVHGPPCTVPNADGKGTAHGECRRVNDCGGVYYKGFCDGPADVVCCVAK